MIETSLQSEPVMLPGRLIRNIAAYGLIAALMLMVSSLSVFLPERGKIQPRRISGTCALHQRKLQVAIKRARQLALIPYVTD